MLKYFRIPWYIIIFAIWDSSVLCMKIIMRTDKNKQIKYYYKYNWTTCMNHIEVIKAVGFQYMRLPSLTMPDLVSCTFSASCDVNL